jgi:Bacterial PH domain
MPTSLPELLTGVLANVSVPNDGARSTATPPTSAGRLKADGKRVFRMTSPVVIWWCWAVAVVLGLGDLAIQGHQFVSLKFAFATLAITGLVYACTAWPRVVADDRGIEVRNPFRRFVVPWTAVRGIYLADSVEVQCARATPRKDKTVYSWALSSPRRSRARAQLRAWQWDQGRRGRPAGYQQLPGQAKTLVKMTTAEIMARELAAMSDDARFRSVVDSVEIDIGLGGQAPGSVSTGKVSTGKVSTGKDSTGKDSTGKDSTGSASAATTGPRDYVVQSSEILSTTWCWTTLLAVLVPLAGFVICALVA